MADPVLEAACVDYLLAAGLPRTPPDVAALVAFVEERASLLYGVADANEPVADPKLASKARPQPAEGQRPHGDVRTSC